MPESATACNCTVCRRIAVNLRLTAPGPVAELPIDHFDGLDKWEDRPRDG